MAKLLAYWNYDCQTIAITCNHHNQSNKSLISGNNGNRYAMLIRQNADFWMGQWWLGTQQPVLIWGDTAVPQAWQCGKHQRCWFLGDHLLLLARNEQMIKYVMARNHPVGLGCINLNSGLKKIHDFQYWWSRININIDDHYGRWFYCHYWYHLLHAMMPSICTPALTQWLVDILRPWDEVAHTSILGFGILLQLFL